MYKNLFKKRSKILGLLTAIFLIAVFFNVDFSNEKPPIDEKATTINILPKAKYTKTGFVKIVDGDSLQFGNKQNQVRLFAIDSPELAQKCTKNNKSWQCGTAAKQALERKINNQKVICIGNEKDKHGRIIATCYLPLNQATTQVYQNLNAWMVKSGWATAYVYYSRLYIAEQKHAKQNKLGIWQGEFLEPFKWRKNNSR